MNINLPQDFITKYQQLLGASAPTFLASFEKAPWKGLRVNPTKAEQVLPLIDTSQPIEFVPGGYYAMVEGKSVVHTSGGVYSQEPSAMYVGEVVAPKSGETVLDLCAAPGGKSTQIAAQMQGQGVLVANEINNKRAKILSENVERFGLKNVLVTNNAPDQLVKIWPQTFDRILVDAPCSGEGMFRKDPDAINYWHKAYPSECANRQREILTSAFQMLKPGGTLIYSTCTFSPEEDEQVIAWALGHYPVKTLPIKKYPGMVDGQPNWADGNHQLKNAVRLWPHKMAVEGHFIAKLKDQRPATTETIWMPKKNNSRSRSNQEFTKTLRDFIDNTFVNNPFEMGHLQLHGDYLHQVSTDHLNLKNVRVLRNGLNIGQFKKQRFLPDHALATALEPNQFRYSYEVNDAEYTKYRHGDVLQLDTPLAKQKVFGLITHKNLGFGLGNFVQKQVKNFYPKGLRQ